MRHGIWSWWDECGNIHIDSNRNQGERQCCLNGILLVAPQQPVFGDPIAPDALHLDRLFGVFANLVGEVLSADRVLLSQAPQACRPSSRIVAIIFQVIITIFSIIYDRRPSLCGSRSRSGGRAAW